MEFGSRRDFLFSDLFIIISITSKYQNKIFCKKFENILKFK